MRLVFRTIIRALRRGTHAKRGMTLIEIMVASLILFVAMAGIVPFFLTGLSQASTIRMRSIATNVAREKMEQIRQLDYREIYTEAMRAGDASLGTRTLESLFGTSETVRGVDFGVTYVVRNQSYQEGTLKEVTVNVGWTAPPKVSSASMTTLVHQQFLGPRGSSLQIVPTQSDPLGSPFPLVKGTTTARYYIAQADWALIYYDLNAANPAPRDVYMRLALFDDNGQSIPLGASANDYRIDASNLHYTRNAEGAIVAVWFQHNFDADSVPDGYWMVHAVAYNEYNEPGNTWRLRVRIEKGAPSAPEDLVATPQQDNSTIVLNWLSGDERDRAYWVVERRTWDYTTSSWLPWVTLVPKLDPRLATYTDVGDVASHTDPWGNDSTHNYYEYSLWAVDKCSPANAGPAVQAQTYLPPLTTTTTLAAPTTTIKSTTTSSSTTTTAGPVTITIRNDNPDYSFEIVIRDHLNHVVKTATAKKNKILTIEGMTNGESYAITATYTDKKQNIVLEAAFVAGSTPNPVMIIK